MERRVIIAPAETDPDIVRALLHRWLEQEGATIRLERETQAQSRTLHWHLAAPHKRGGTLELTFAVGSPPRIYLDVHDNRAGVWSVPAQERLLVFLRQCLDTRDGV